MTTPHRLRTRASPSPQDPELVRYTFVKNVAVPALLQDGVSEEQVGIMTVEAPRRFLTGESRWLERRPRNP